MQTGQGIIAQKCVRCGNPFAKYKPRFPLLQNFAQNTFLCPLCYNSIVEFIDNFKCDSITDQNIMAKIQSVRDKTGYTTGFTIDGDAYESGENELMYTFYDSLGLYKKQRTFPTREDLVAHLDGILEGL